MGLLLLVYVYLFGGVTFVPLLIFGFIYLHPILQEQDEDDEIDANGAANGPNDPQKPEDYVPHEKFKATELEELQKSGLGAYMAGWVTVTQEYIESMNEITSSTQSISESHENKSAYLSLYKLVKNSETETETEIQGEGGVRRPSGSSLEPISANLSDDNKKLKNLHRKHRFYAVLRHGNLFLYKNEKKVDVKHVIVLSSHIVSIWPRNIPDPQLFTKRTCICIMKKDYSRARSMLEGDSGSVKITINDILKLEKLKPPRGSFFLYCDKNIDKEDWYFALIRATKCALQPIPGDIQRKNSSASILSAIADEATITSSNSSIKSSAEAYPSPSATVSGLDPNIYAKSLHFSTPHIINLIQTIYSSEGQFQTKWLNALIGRIFLGLQQTETLKNYLLQRIEKKLTKINKPGFLDEFQITKLDVGNSAPYFTYPLLKEISPDGTLVVSANIHYHGNLSVQIATKLLVNLGVRLKPREVDVLLSVTIQKLEGRLLVKIKPPPSGRIWYSFEHEPTMDLKIEPIVSSRQLTYSIITSTIDKKFKEAIRDSLVLPHWDDLVFYDTSDEVYRGGIWDKLDRQEDCSKSKNSPQNTQHTAASSVLDDVDEIMSLNSVFTDDNINAKIELTPTISNSSSNGAKQKLTSTLTDISKKIKRSKSSSSTTNEDSLSSERESQDDKYSINTLKKIGKWYFKDGKDTPVSSPTTATGSVTTSVVTSTGSASVVTNPSTYKPPEMILNRRQKKTTHIENELPSLKTVVKKPSYEMFGKHAGASLPAQLPVLTGMSSFEDFQPSAGFRARGNSNGSFHSTEHKHQSSPLQQQNFESEKEPMLFSIGDDVVHTEHLEEPRRPKRPPPPDMFPSETTPGPSK